MKTIRVTEKNQPFFADAWQLYRQSFPKEERRSFDTQLRMLRETHYHFEVAVEGSVFMGFILWWEFESLRFIEHFATVPHTRGKGLGSRLLKQFIERQSSRILLEVEPPHTEAGQRRINFYNRIGFQINYHFYQQPPLHKDTTAVKLLLLSFPEEISEPEVQAFVKNCHPVIYKTDRQQFTC